MNEKVVPGEDIAPVSFPRVPPEKNVGRYFESKLQDEQIWHFPDWDACRPEPAMDLIKARRDLLQADTRLAAKREEYIKEREQLDAEWKDLADKEQTLRKSFIMFHKFVKENQEKKERARRRITDENQIHIRRDEEINTINEKIIKMTSVRDSMEDSVKKLKMYEKMTRRKNPMWTPHDLLIHLLTDIRKNQLQLKFEDYLSDVVAISPTYRSINSILNRYDALCSAKYDLVMRQKAGLEELERERISMMELIEERVGVLMGLNNDLADLQSRYEKSKQQNRYWENVVYEVKSRSAAELLKTFIVKDSIWNLYVLMCMRKGGEIEIKKDDVEEQLNFIKSTINQYKRIVKIAARKCNDASSVNTKSTFSVK